MIQITPGNVMPVNTSEVFKLQTAARDWTVTATSSFISIETTNYRRFADFLERWCAVFDAACEALDLKLQTRIGLRYQNQIDLPDASASTLQRAISAPLLGPVASHRLTTEPVASFQEVQLSLGDARCTLRHGLQLTPAGSPTYLLDIDVFDEHTLEINDHEDHFKQLESFNELAWEIFEWSVTPEQFALFSPEGGANDAAA